MKIRVKIDVTLLILIILSSGIFFLFPGLYHDDPFYQIALDVLGILCILKGCYLRMAARGLKKASSRQGESLVIKGLYRYTRNPMYLGSFLLGAGFLLVLWPWWTLPAFVLLFYMRFKKQIMVEEQQLTERFGESYKRYMKETPRLFPKVISFITLNVRECFPLKETWGTKESRGIFLWTLLAFLLDLLQQYCVYHNVDIKTTVLVFAGAIGFFIVEKTFRYIF